MSRISLIVPTLNAEHELPVLLDAVMSQTRVPDEILIVDSSSDDKTVELAESYVGVRTMTVRRKDFDHGGTRQLALESVRGEYVLFLTQDAVPADECYVENLLVPFEDSSIAMVSGRQLPKPDARRFVQLVQKYNYPPESNVRTVRDIERLGIKACFASDACSAYRRVAVEAIGGIPRPCSTNEDMLAAIRLLRKGYKVSYAADACVFHSHSLTFQEQYQRNYAIGVFLEEHANELRVGSEVGEGIKMAQSILSQLIREKSPLESISFVLDCIARFIGNRQGRALGRQRSI